ncbi:MAG: type II toxin-antitoxin system RelE/ParE family toxin [Desulfobacterales bacterium]|nr:type II toxin-antitoxin system RelE/ParE family toxin [Desulfobacterales bacterium]MBF0395674.1 type II toxin-antitoxin system RelE/ParE family toxin [Desulfobacterales bacterium]
MKRQVEYHPAAKEEIYEAIIWYEDKVEGLGLELMFELKQAEHRIIQEPEMWHKYESETRRYLLKRFPYAIIYMIAGKKIQIIAFAHYKRKPGYWEDRV